MTEFTKGKWTADDMGEYVFAHGYDMMICQMRGWGYLKAQGLSDYEAIEVQKANARLIAAAPEMFELLKVCAKTETPSTYIQAFLNLKDKARELLERIDGETSKGSETEC